MYRDRISGFGLSRVPSIDLSILVAMFALMVMAWGVSKLDRVFVASAPETPVFAVAAEITVSPVIEPKASKDAMKVGKFMSLAKSQAATAVKEMSNADISKKIVIESGSAPAAKLYAPKVLYKTMPDYPVKAIEASYTGTAIVQVYILKNGRVGEASVIGTSGHEMLDKSAVAAVSQWVFEPALMGKEPTEAYFKVPVKFQLNS